MSWSIVSKASERSRNIDKRRLLTTNSIDEVVTNVEENSFSGVVFVVVSIKQVISGKTISKVSFDSMFNGFGDKRQVRYMAIVGQLFLVLSRLVFV